MISFPTKNASKRKEARIHKNVPSYGLQIPKHNYTIEVSHRLTEPVQIFMEILIESYMRALSCQKYK